MEMLYLAVLGKPAFHSLSPVMHNAAMRKLGIKGVYLAFEVDDFEGAVLGAMKLGFRGLNITLPYKENAYKIADEKSDECEKIKAGNTILFSDGKIKLFNTDIYGFQKAVEKSDFKIQGANIAVIGGGGAARAIVFACIQKNCKAVHIFNRTEERAKQIAQELNDKRIETKPLKEINFEDYDIIVNATSLGWKGENLFDAIEKYPEKNRKGKKKLFFDTVYKPTEFLHIAKKLGYQTQDGRWMLVYQGALSFKIWTSLTPDENLMFKAITKEIRKRERT